MSADDEAMLRVLVEHERKDRSGLDVPLADEEWAGARHDFRVRLSCGDVDPSGLLAQSARRLAALRPLIEARETAAHNAAIEAAAEAARRHYHTPALALDDILALKR